MAGLLTALPTPGLRVRAAGLAGLPLVRPKRHTVSALFERATETPTTRRLPRQAAAQRSR